MKTKIFSIIALLAAAVGLGACSEDWQPNTEKTGQVALKDNLGVMVDDAQNVLSRAEHDIDNFLVKIYRDNEYDTPVNQWKYSELPEIFSLPVGDYRVDVCSHEVQKAEWDNPYYFGSQTFKIENSKITEIGAVTCKFSSVRVSVKFTDDLRAALGDDVQVRVVVNDEGELYFDPEETRSGYYEAVEGSTTMAAFFTGTVNGYKENLHKVYEDVAAGQHRIITFSLRSNPLEPDPETGFIDPANGINVDISVDNEDINGNVTPSEEPITPGHKPGEEEFVEDVDLKFDAATSALTVKAGAGIQSLTLGFGSDNADAATAFAAINGLDLADAASASAVAAYGLPTGTAVAGQTALTADFTKLIEAIKEYEGNHTLTFTATDTKANSANGTTAIKGNGGIEPITFESALRFDTPMNPSDETDGVVKMIVPAGIAHLVVTINSTNEDFTGVAGAISGTDFAYPGDMAETLTGFGLANGDEVLNQTDVDFDITMFMSPAFLPGFAGRHEFKLAVTDNDGNEKSATIIFEVQ